MDLGLGHAALNMLTHLILSPFAHTRSITVKYDLFPLNMYK